MRRPAAAAAALAAAEGKDFGALSVQEAVGYMIKADMWQCLTFMRDAWTAKK